MKRRCTRLLPWSLSALAVAGCAGRIPLPAHLRVDSQAELRTRMEAANATVGAYSADARLTYFGPEGRIRTNATIVVSRPASLRYDLHGPHSGVLVAFATNGHEVQLVDFKTSRYRYGKATAETLDALMAFAALGLPAAGWVRLLFGEMAVPPEAALHYDDTLGRFVLAWLVRARQQQIEVDPATSRIVRVLLKDGMGSGASVLWQVEVQDRNSEGIPTRLRIRANSPAGAEEVDVTVGLADLQILSEVAASVFHLDPPRGVSPERLGGRAYP